MRFMPKWLINFMVKNVCHTFLDLIQKKAIEVPTSAYGERMKERKEYYENLERMIAETE